MRWELFNETKEVTFNPASMMNIKGVDTIIEELTEYSRKSEIEEREYVDSTGKITKGYFLKTRLKETMQSLLYFAKILDYKCARDEVTFYKQIGVEAEAGLIDLPKLNMVASLLMMKFSDFCFESGTYRPIFDLIGDQVLSFTTAKNILLGAGEKIIPPKPPEPEKPKVKSKFPGKRKRVRKDRFERYDD